MGRRQTFSTPWAHPRSSLPIALLLPLFAFLAWFYLPVTRGDFVADDYVFLATARVVDTPLDAFWQSHFYEPYYFRPVGVLVWWLLTDNFRLDYGSHSMITLFLHIVNAGLLMALLRALALRTSAVIAGVVLFALGPFALATILWPSNRFDLLACGFLLMQAIATMRALQGKVLAMSLAMLAALAACWSKELAYPVATVMAFVALAATSVPRKRRIVLFALLGLAIGGAFVMRHYVLNNAYAIASNDPITQITGGITAMISALPKLTTLIVGSERVNGFSWGLAGALLAALVWSRRDAGEVNGMIGAAVLVLLAAVLVQTPLIKNFSVMLDGGPFGTITFARFYYAPWLAACVLAALILTRGRLGGFAAMAVVTVTIAAAITARPLPESFASWTRSEVRPMSIAATKVVEEGAGAGASAGSNCVYVFLGTQTKHPYFRMFSDVTVKALTTMPEKVWRCHILTESTPWIFAFPTSVTPADLPLRPIINPDGTAKADSTWSSIRYRYRLPAKDVATLPGARFFDWRDRAFVEVTNDVRSDERKVKALDW
jgi:hypothetical protein